MEGEGGEGRRIQSLVGAVVAKREHRSREFQHQFHPPLACIKTRAIETEKKKGKKAMGKLRGQKCVTPTFCRD